jgi:hypothetical protein
MGSAESGRGMRRKQRRTAWRSFNLDAVVSRTGLKLENATRKARRQSNLDQRGAALTFLSALDLGTTHVKALVCRIDDGRIEVLGQGVEPYAGSESTGGKQAMTRACDQALTYAEDMTEYSFGQKVVADQVVVGVPASTIRLHSFEFPYRRRDAGEPITEDELARTMRSAQRAALRDLRELEGPIPDPVLLSACTAAQVEIDGHLTNDPLGLRGEQLGITVCNTLASSALIGAIEQLVDSLQLDPPLLALQPQSVLVAWSHLLGADGVGIDIGGRHSTICLWRAGLLRGLMTVPSGGRDITASLGRVCRLSESEAESLKFAYARDRLEPDQTEWVAGVLRPQLARWRDAVAAGLLALTRGAPMPSDIWVWGGGSVMGDMTAGVREALQAEGLVFRSYPNVRALDGLRNTMLHDRTGFSMGPMGANVQALAGAQALPGQSTPVDRFLRKATLSASDSEQIPVWMPAYEPAS